MIVKCIDNKFSSIPEKYLDLGPEQVNDERLTCSINKYYAVYANQTNKDTLASWYFIYTDEGHLWWMPAILFEIFDVNIPQGWVDDIHNSYLTSSYPSLHNWKIEEGIIDNEKDAILKFMSEVKADISFPQQSEIDNLNYEFEKKLNIDKYNEDLKLAKENGWEWPKKPENI